ncbi:MAG: hypothetical protein FD174_4068 [Geobacteraceae bacterium]|nr:MAG: hypothetical protein FD174_4068 [Geobacteraceae bacterium]
MKRLLPFIVAILLVSLSGARGEEPSERKIEDSQPLHDAEKASPPGEAYRTPLAGEAYRTVLFGYPVEVPFRDRRDVRAFSVGANVYTPAVGEDNFIPIAALYWNKQNDPTRLRAIVAVFMNELEVARRFGNVELIGRWENDTVPFPSTEVSRGSEVKGSSIIWGTFSGYAGAGVRYPVHPFQADNDLRLQLLYQAGYLYSRPTDDTAPTVLLPPDTFLQGLKLRGRYDGMRRNLMEMVHSGVSLGFDADMVRRDRWGDANYGGGLFRGEDTRDYVKVSGFLTAATKVPWLSERDRLIVSIHAGYSPGSTLDRFSAFRIGGGLYPNEAEDMRRPYYPGALYNQFPVTDYIVTNFEYRREILFCLFLHLRGTLISGKRPDFQPDELELLKDRGEAFSLGITSGMPWKSQIYFEYAYDEEALRDDLSGSSFLVLWSKAF